MPALWSVVLSRAAPCATLARDHSTAAVCPRAMADVLHQQANQEMLLLHARGIHALYRRLVLFNQFFFTCGAGLFSAVGISLYEGLRSFAGAFYAAAAISTIVGVSFGTFFALRDRAWRCP